MKSRLAGKKATQWCLLALITGILALTGCQKEAITPALDEKAAFLEKARQFVQTAAPAADAAQLDWTKAIVYKKDNSYQMVRVPLKGNTQPGQKAVYLSYSNGKFSGNYFELTNNTVTTLSLDNVRKCVAPVTGNGQVGDYTVYENGQAVQDGTGMAITLRPPLYIYSFNHNLYYLVGSLGLGQSGGGQPNNQPQVAASYLSAVPDGSEIGNGGGGFGGIVSFSQAVVELIVPLNLYFEQAVWLQQYQPRAMEMNFFLNESQYSELNSLDKQQLALAHLHSMMTDADYLEMVDSYSASTILGHPWMLELFKELATEIGLKVLKKYIPGYGDWQSIKDAINDAGHGNWLSALGEVLNIVKKKVPLLAVIDAIVDVFDFGKLANKAWKAFNKIQRVSENAFNGLIKTIKDKCGGILDKIEHSSITDQGVIRYNPDDAENFVRLVASNIGVGIVPTSTPGVFYFDVGDIRFTYYPVSSPLSGGKHTLKLNSLNSNWEYKFRFEP